MSRATWFCVDIECSGPVPHLYDMISLGAVPVTAGSDGKFHVGEQFYVEICPTAPRIDKGAMAVNDLDIEALRRDGLSLHAALVKLSEWVALHTAPESQPVFVGHNAPFDWSFVAYGYVISDLKNPFGYKALDTKALSMGVLGWHWLDTNKERLQTELGLPEQEADQVHRADYDAWYQGLILSRLLERRPSCADL